VNGLVATLKIKTRRRPGGPVGSRFAAARLVRRLVLCGAVTLASASAASAGLDVLTSTDNDTIAGAAA